MTTVSRLACLSLVSLLFGCEGASETAVSRTPSYPDAMVELRGTLDAAALPMAVAKGAVGRTSVFDSKLLGTPYMPRGFEYPRDPDGRPLTLLAQINFADVPPLPRYPSSGILQFYISDDIDDRGHVWGLQFYERTPHDPVAQFVLQQSQDYFRVVWHKDVVTDTAQLSDSVPRTSGGVMPIDDEAKLSFSADLGYPIPIDYRFERIVGQNEYDFFDRFGDEADDVMIQYYDFAVPQSIAWIGGYAFFTQSDPRENVRDDDWLLLLEIQSTVSEDQPSVMWGDAGIGAFFIRAEDLEKRNFSRVLYTWDNH
ncbi:MAG: DUF1963 domain-containing protein [Pseudomonadota bacterium]